MVLKKKEERDEAKNLVFRKKVWYTKNIWIPSTTGNAPPVKQGHILLETGWSTRKGGKTGWEGIQSIDWGRGRQDGCKMSGLFPWKYSEKKTTSSHICSALWLVENPLKSVPWANFIEGFYNLINRSFLWVLCGGLSPPGWLLNETESRAYTTQIEAHSWYYTTRLLYFYTSPCILEDRESKKTGSAHRHMFVPDSRKNLFLCYSWLVIYIEHLIQMEAWKRAVIRADRNRWNTCFLLLLLLFLFFFLFLRVFFIPIAWQSTSGSYQGYMRPKQWNKEKKIFFFFIILIM